MRRLSRSGQPPVRPTRIVLDFLEHVRDEFSTQVFLGKLGLQTSERKSNHIRGRDGNPFKLRLCSNPPDPLMLFRGQRCGDLVVGLRSARHHASSLASGHLDGKSLLHHEAAADEGSPRALAGIVPA
jgi:hypothetical protein